MASPTPTTSISPLTGDPIIDAMTSGYKWQVTSDRTIDWSYSNGIQGEPLGGAAAFDFFNTSLSVFSLYANIKFNFLGPFSSPFSAAAGGSEINFAIDGSNSIFQSNNVWAIGVFPSTSYIPIIGYNGAPGDIYFNERSAFDQLSTYLPGGVGWTVIIHEIGHALGLKHPHDGGGTGRPTFDVSGIGNLDSYAFTVMSYNDDYDWNQVSNHPLTPMVLDVLALQYMYGPNLTANAGDSVFTIGNYNDYRTFWDPSGYDLLDASEATFGWSIALPYLTVSNLNPVKIGEAVPYTERDSASPHTLIWLMGDMESVKGSNFNDAIRGNDLGNRLFGGGGNDGIFAGNGTNYLRGEDGDDHITGGAGFDDINGNAGNDTASGGLGGDWVVGGKDNDSLSGDAGADIVYGNLGNDSGDGGTGDDIIRGGQGDDVLFGGVGNDWISGDRGDDTITGGAGADTFNSFGGAGIDRILDFNYAEGDRIRFDPGTAGNYLQVGADLVVTLEGGAVITIVGVQLSALPADWYYIG